MHWDHIEAGWKEFAGSARAHWSKLTNEDWQAMTGNKEHLAERIQRRYGIAKKEADKQVEAWSRALRDAVTTSNKT